MKTNPSALTRYSKIIDKRLAELARAGRRGLARRTNSESEAAFAKYARAAESFAGVFPSGSVRPREIAAGAAEVKLSPRTLEHLAGFALEVMSAANKLHARRRRASEAKRRTALARRVRVVEAIPRGTALTQGSCRPSSAPRENQAPGSGLLGIEAQRS